MNAGYRMTGYSILLLFFLLSLFTDDVNGKSITQRRSTEAVFTKPNPTARDESGDEFEDDPEDPSEDNTAAYDELLITTTWKPTATEALSTSTVISVAASFPASSTIRPRLHYQPVVLTELNWEIIVAVIFGSMAASMLLTIFVYCMCGRPEEGHLI